MLKESLLGKFTLAQKQNGELQYSNNVLCRSPIDIGWWSSNLTALVPCLTSPGNICTVGCAESTLGHTVALVIAIHSQKCFTYCWARGANQSWCLAPVKKIESTENFKYEVNTGNSHLDSRWETKRRLKPQDEIWKCWNHRFDYWTLQERYLKKEWNRKLSRRISLKIYHR